MEIKKHALNWAQHDPNPEDAAYIRALIDDPSRSEELSSRFNGPLTFGTAGLRGEIGPGESRMNRAVVTRATAGLMDWLTQRVDQPRVVIGCDARHGSADFYTTAAETVSAAGGIALALPQRLPTPLTAFAVRALGADAGIMITASHNPPADNGYKVYLGGRVATGDAAGVQIVPPVDGEIMDCITSAPPADQVPRSTEHIEKVEIVEDYLAGIPSGPARNLKIVLTAMHGVGGAVAVEALKRAGFGDVHVVDTQIQPDPDFPTVSFPNPEEPGALDAAVELATAVDADVIVALDPDADRCAVAVPEEGRWRQLTGDETGCLLGDYLGARAETGVLANSIVSSRLLGAIAKGHGLEHRNTLTGFKWIGRVPGLVYGYEEAIGYCCAPERVRDKDGITAAVTMARLLAELRESGLTVWDKLDEFARHYGLHATAPLTFRVADVSVIPEVMQRLRSDFPAVLARAAVTSVVDLSRGYEGLPPTDGLMCFTEADDRVIIRPSGTEPKLKCYLEVILPGDSGTWEEARARLDLIGTELAAAIGL